jgi:hypothetical protein
MITAEQRAIADWVEVLEARLGVRDCETVNDAR